MLLFYVLTIWGSYFFLLKHPKPQQFSNCLGSWNKTFYMALILIDTPDSQTFYYVLQLFMTIYIFNKNLSPFIPRYNWTKLLGICDLRMMLLNKLWQAFLSKTKVDSTYGTNKPTQENWLSGSQVNKWWEEVHLGKPGNLASFEGLKKRGNH